MGCRVRELSDLLCKRRGVEFLSRKSKTLSCISSILRAYPPDTTGLWRWKLHPNKKNQGFGDLQIKVS